MGQILINILCGGLSESSKIGKLSRSIRTQHVKYSLVPIGTIVQNCFEKKMLN